MTINIEWQDQNGNWHHYQSKQNLADAYRVAKNPAESSKILSTQIPQATTSAGRQKKD